MASHSSSADPVNPVATSVPGAGISKSSISVALCTYNGERYLAEQLASILDGTLRPSQVVISDDGSTDATMAIVREWADTATSTGITVTVLTDAPTHGVTANFARAIAACTGELIVLSDQDDRWQPSRLAAVSAAFTANPDLLLQHADARLVDAAGTPIGRTLFESLGVTAADIAAINSGHGFERYLRRNLATGATVALRRSLLAAAEPLPNEWVHDEWLAIIASIVGRVDVSTEQVIDYRQHGSNQIGVAQPTLKYKLERMLRTSPDRNEALARRSTILAERLTALPRVPALFRESAKNKAAFERARATLPVSRPARAIAILRLARGGSYQSFASQGALDMLRDLLVVRRS
ncbi:MAG: glycosyltransferase family 2 protein [Glaciihabitans sp.]|nr:glycosyltransferase family 2 protein [Glaciihabitans sp.]